MPQAPFESILQAFRPERDAGRALREVLATLPPLGPEGPWVAGGAVRRTLAGEALDADVDVFFRDWRQEAEFALGLEERGFALVEATIHHRRYRGAPDAAGRELDVQLVHFARHADAESLVDSFDFTICQFAYDGATLTYGSRSLADLSARRLAVHRVTFPGSTLFRVAKYRRRGYVPGLVTRLRLALLYWWRATGGTAPYGAPAGVEGRLTMRAALALLGRPGPAGAAIAAARGYGA